MRSLRARLLVGAIAGAAAVLLAAGMLLYVAVRRAVVAQLDEVLRARAHQVAGAIEMGRGGIEIDSEDYDAASYAAGSTEAYMQVWSSQGATLHRSPSLTHDLPRLPGGPQARLDWLELPDGRLARSIQLDFVPEFDDDDDRWRDRLFGQGATRGALTLRLARDAAAAQATLRAIGWSMAFAAAVTVALTAAIIAVVVRRALRPVAALAAQVESIGPDDLSARLDAPRLPAELQPVQDRFNALLVRVQAALQRERQFTADAAHELRTPLAALRTGIEVALRGPRDADACALALSEALPVARQLQAMVENLLMLARLEAGGVEADSEWVNLSDLVAATWKPLAARAAEAGVQVRFDLSPQAEVSSDYDLLTLIVRNLLENALCHAVGDGGIDVRSRVEGGTASLEIENSTDLSPADAPQVFERYWRASSARSEAGVHCGLGLSLVRRTAEALGAEVAAAVQDGRFRIRLSLPLGEAE